MTFCGEQSNHSFVMLWFGSVGVKTCSDKIGIDPNFPPSFKLNPSKVLFWFVVFLAEDYTCQRISLLERVCTARGAFPAGRAPVSPGGPGRPSHGATALPPCIIGSRLKIANFFIKVGCKSKDLWNNQALITSQACPPANRPLLHPGYN